MPPVHSHSSSHVTPSYKMETSTMKHGMQTCNIKLPPQNVMPIVRKAGYAVSKVFRLHANVST